VQAKVRAWARLMGRRVSQAREILRTVLVGRIGFQPQADGGWEFRASATPGPLFAGLLPAGGKAVVPPGGPVAPYTVPLRARVPAA
jgi:hypothetical protein